MEKQEIAVCGEGFMGITEEEEFGMLKNIRKGMQQQDFSSDFESEKIRVGWSVEKIKSFLAKEEKKSILRRKMFLGKRFTNSPKG